MGTGWRRSSLLVGALSNWVPLVVNTAIGLVLTPFVVAQVGPREYGMWSLVMSFVGYYGLLRLSVGTGVMRYVPFYGGRRDEPAVSQIVSTGLALFTVVGLVIWVVSALIAGAVGRFFNGGHELSTLVWITGIAAAVECPMRIFDAALRAHERWVTANVITVANALIYAGGVTACLLAGYGVIQMAWALVVANIMALAMSVVALTKSCPEIRLGIALVRWNRLRELLAFGMLTVVGTMAYSLGLQNHRLIIGKLVSLEAVTVYAIAAMLIEKVRNVVGAPLQVAWPRFALLEGEKDYDGVTRLFYKTTHWGTILACGVVLQVLLLGPVFIRLWMGGSFESAGAVLIVLGLGCLVEGTFYANGSLLGGTGRQGVQASFATVEALCGFALSIVLARRIGLVGVAWGYVIFAALMRGLVSTWYVCRLLKMGIIGYCLGTFWRPWLILVVLLAAGHLVRAPERADRWVSWLGLSLFAAGLYVAATYLLVLNREDKDRVVSVLRRVPSFM